ncbi:class I SAM-dependent methyltransferase [Ovoidimarina sediminis]|uniref:class I SAM-dependent methyltransferase n=1 Tax=Ovoidimarina sediminis TaxID=3079856 RepID=UPI002909A553|nr:methyltransferase domain-containing protein [Rhodophyticola sp. MJ-SS7]MDU8943429.1 methyltransferase domain-containing protein [Rhodophyticola sp. MJ-SS7]
MAEHPEDPLSTRTQGIYERQAETYDARRSRALFEARWLRRFAGAMPEGGRVLDLGCGSGRPIAGWLIGEGFRLTGADFSEPMLELARARWPNGDWRLSDMRTLDLPDRFDGIIGWDSFFHLTPDEQRACLPRLARHLVPGGVLMVTVGPREGEAAGVVGAEPVYHASLSVAEYATVLAACGMRMTAYLAEDPDCDYHSVMMALRGA